MICEYISKNNIKCNNTVIGNLNFCHMKKHHTDKELYNDYLKKEENKFNSKTIPRDKFTIIDVPRDGACLFTSISNFIIDNLQYFEKFKIHNFISNKRNYEENNKIETIARYIQNELKNWVFHNKKLKVPYVGNISLEDWVLMIHGEEGYESIEDYFVFFDTYAGDLDIIEIDNEEEQEIIEIPERWGTIIELFAFHKIYKVNVNIYVLKRFDKNKVKEVNCTKRSKYARFALRESLYNKDYFNDLNLYFNMSNKTYHYEYLKKN